MSKVKRECPRCGAATFMARHANRAYCGRCHYTEFSQPPAKQQKPQPQHKPQPQQKPQPPQQQPAKKG